MKRFTRKVENFICENCGFEVIGNGYTNRCPKCLYSKHVDINPGDRLCGCNGIMKPVEIIKKNGEFVILHKCQKCGFERKNKVNENDDYKKIIEISSNKS